MLNFDLGEEHVLKRMFRKFRRSDGSVVGVRLFPEQVGQIVADLAGWAATSTRVAEVARRLTRHTIGHNQHPLLASLSELEAVRGFVRQTIRHTRDPLYVEIVHTPQRLLELVQANGGHGGDCDDSTALSLSLLTSLGHRCRAVLVGSYPGHYEHILTQSWIEPLRRWVCVDTTTVPGDNGMNRIQVAKTFNVVVN